MRPYRRHLGVRQAQVHDLPAIHMTRRLPLWQGWQAKQSRRGSAVTTAQTEHHAALGAGEFLYVALAHGAATLVDGTIPPHHSTPDESTRR